MNSSLNQTILGIIGGVILLLLVGGAAFYIEGRTKEIAATVAPQTYPVSGLSIFTSGGGIIQRLSSLQSVPQSEPQANQYSATELGRTDITKEE